MMSPPQVSVVVPAYNVSAYLANALISLEQQTFGNFEVLIVDDGSTDDTPQIAQVFVDRDPRFRLIQKTNGGLSSARNAGIAVARGEYIALLDGDDAYKPQKLATHVVILQSRSEVGVVYSASQAMREDGQPTWMRLSGHPVHRSPLIALLLKNFVGHGSNGVFRRCLVNEIGYFDERLPSVEDLDFWLRIAATGKWQFYRESQDLCYYRVRPSGLSFNLDRMQATHIRVIENIRSQVPQLVNSMMPTAYAYMYRYLARVAMTAGDVGAAREFLDQAWAADAQIFGRDPRSLLTLVSVKLAPITRFVLARSLGSAI